MRKKTPHLGERLPQVRLPRIKRLKEAVARRIALPDADEPLRAALDEDAVNQPRHALVRRDPVGVPAPEQRKRDAVRGARAQAAEPRDEARRVVRGLALERRGDDHDGRVRGEVPDGAVERRERRAEACGGAVSSPRMPVWGEIPATCLSPTRRWRSAARTPPSSPCCSRT